MSKFGRSLLLVVFFGLTFSLHINAQSMSDYSVGDYIERDDDTDIMAVSPEDVKMNAAIERALDTIDYFFDALDSGEHPRESFEMKIMTETAPKQWEHMWYIFMDLTENGEVTGLLTHSPYAESSDYKAGEVYTLPAAYVSDWRYLENDKSRGDFTTRVVLDMMRAQNHEDAEAQFALLHADPLPPRAE